MRNRKITGLVLAAAILGSTLNAQAAQLYEPARTPVISEIITEEALAKLAKSAEDSAVKSNSTGVRETAVNSLQAENNRETENAVGVKSEIEEIAELDSAANHIVFLDMNSEKAVSNNVTSDGDISNDMTSNGSASKDTVSISNITNGTTSDSNVSNDMASDGNVSSDTASDGNASSDTASDDSVSSDTASDSNASNDTLSNGSIPNDSTSNGSLSNDTTSDTIVSNETTSQDSPLQNNALQNNTWDNTVSGDSLSGMEGSLEEDSEISSGETEMEESSTGGYVFAGYLPDGTPNYVWQGEGFPAVLETVYGVMLMSEMDETLSAQAYSSASFNYLKDAVRILDRAAEMSDSTSSLSDGLHTAADGRVRAYKGGKYFKKGRFALDGQVYYADVNGYLYSGWIAISKTGDLSSKKKSDYVWKYCDPDTYVRFENGRKVIDGMCHYFIPETSGNLAFNKGISASDGYYFCDNYGVCAKIKRKYSSAYVGEGGDSELAINQLPSSQVVNLYNKIMDGSYSFYPKWYKNVSEIETFGFVPNATDSGTTVYCALTDDSLKGKIGCWYRKIGKFQGRQVDIKCTITDYTFYEFQGDKEIGYFQVSLNKIGLNATNLRDITANMEFYDHESGQPVKVKGFATFADIDICQGLEILSGTDQIYVDENCRLYKDPSRNLFTAPWEEGLNGSVVDDANREYWVQADYDSYNLSYKFYSARENFEMSADGMGRSVNGESKCVWAEDYTGSVYDYDIVNTAQGVLWQGWQGLYYGRLGRVSISPLSKTVSDSDETDALKNTLSATDETFVYKLYHYVPSEASAFYYESYQVYDDLHADLSIDASTLKVELDDGTDVTGRFQAAVTGQRVTFTARQDALAAEDFYNNNYCFRIGVSVKETEHLNQSRQQGMYTVKNTAHVQFSRTLGQGNPDTENADSNEVETTLAFPYISIVKKDVNTQEILKDAEFTLYEYHTQTGTYLTSGTVIPYAEANQAYLSPRLNITSENQGRFKLKETKPPKGYIGDWEKEITLTAENIQKPNLEFTVTNEPDVLPRGEITIVKKIKEADIIWAHGNPVFLFQVKGRDTRGNIHTYEEMISFDKNSYTKDSHGYALCEITISNIPVGTYDITEKKVLRYRLAEVTSPSANVSVFNNGTDTSREASYAKATLSVNTPKATIVFRNEKTRFDGYSHTDTVKNTITFA